MPAHASPIYRNMIARVTLPVIIAAFLIQPDLINMSAIERLILLLAITFGLMLLEAAGYAAGFLRVLMVAFAIAPTAIAFNFFVSGEPQDRAWNDKRCMAIQSDMLSAQPRREDGPDLFQALGCKPHGQGSVFAKPTKFERQAGHSLKDGGRQ